MNNFRSLSSAVFAVGLFFTGAAHASATPYAALSPNTTAKQNLDFGITLWEWAKGRKIQQTGGNLHLVLAVGDSIETTHDGTNALWKDSAGNILVTFDAHQIFSAKMATIKYDNNNSILYAVISGEKHDSMHTRYGCANKLVSWRWAVAWTGLVCVPFGVVTGGVGGVACTLAGGAIGTAASC